MKNTLKPLDRSKKGAYGVKPALLLFCERGGNMFRNLGRKFMQGAKDELNENPPVNVEGFIQAADILLKAGLFALIMFCGSGKSGKHTAPTVIVNNYISKEE